MSKVILKYGERIQNPPETVGKTNITTVGVNTRTLPIGDQATASATLTADKITFSFGLPAGAPGPQGSRGETGPQGETGNGIVSVELISGTHAPGTTDTYNITFTNGNSTTFTVYNGADGDGAGDMTKAVYDANGTVAAAGGVAHYVAQRIQIYTATIGTTWEGDAAPYTQTISVTGITADDNPIVGVVYSDTFETVEAQKAAWSCLYRIKTEAGQIVVYASDPTAAEIPIQLMCVRK